jgi:hypothetical protein
LREKSDQFIDRGAIVQAADRRPDPGPKAEPKAKDAQEADVYVLDPLRRLEVELERSLGQVWRHQALQEEQPVTE